ncbi:LTA synthase family protein [Oscillibacter sp.]|uniref:LTA synthase family protein n=1 Tax=Oscillibacter sp. TaxID=1945593 RepID=UPI002614504F|nr:LTA synthase family protein [Oscillibacter sp.]MDD3347232.1 LTA synthase family protein [Oscillibacter sp.]
MKQHAVAPTGGHSQERTALLRISLLALAVTLVVELLNHKVFTAGPDSFFRFMAENPLAFLVDVWIVLLTLVPAIFLRRRFFYATLLTALWVVGGAVNGFILLNRMTPFTVADFTVLNTGLDTLPNYLSTKYIVLLAVAAAGLVLGLALLLWKGPRNALPRRRRMFSGILSALIVFGALCGTWTLAFRLDQLSTIFSNLAVAYEEYGFSYCFLQTWLNKGIALPAGYGAQAIADVEKTVGRDFVDPTQSQTDVNVVYVQLESFVDPAEISGLELSEDAVPTWTALTAKYSSGYLTVPVVGAGTANTECEVLTGMSTRFFGPGEYPYQTRLKDRTVESVAFDLKENGYATHAIHNHRATFYSRNQVYANLGFDDFTSLEYMPRVELTPKNWAKDSVLTGQIVKALDVTPDQPDLVFTVSVQGHGKYPTEPVLEDPAVTVTACPDEDYRYAIEYYVNQIREMDQFVAELTAALSQREEKTVLVLYGDHLPSLGLEHQDMKSGTLYRTGYVVWNNFGMEKQDEDLSSFQLSAVVMGRLGISTGFVNRFHQSCREESMYRWDLRLLQYDMLYGQKYLYGGQTPYAATQMQMGVAPIVLEGLSQRGDVWYLSGENFTPYCKVTVKGKLLDTIYLSPWLLQVTEDPGTEDAGDLFISVVDKHREILSDTE